jgi:hypothetical protein
MQQDWRALLSAEGARFDGERVTDFGDPSGELRAALHGDVRCDLSHYGLIRVCGDDAETFLQGQLTADLREIAAGGSRLAAWCNPKGRMLASMRLLRWADGFLLRLPRERLDAVLSRLRLYLLRARVTLADVSDELPRIGLSVPAAAALLQQLGMRLPEAVGQVLGTGPLAVVRVPGLHPRCEILGPGAAMADTWRGLAAARAVGADGWGLLETLSGVPEIHRETVEAFVPQMTNLELLGGVSFTKGCYTGQEVVARTQHLGKLKRRMYLARLSEGPRPAPNAALLAGGEAGAAEVGRVVTAYPDGSGGWQLLAVVQIAAVGGAITVEGAGNSSLRFEALPYPVPMPAAV